MPGHRQIQHRVQLTETTVSLILKVLQESPRLGPCRPLIISPLADKI